jgi:hypothetical protein
LKEDWHDHVRKAEGYAMSSISSSGASWEQHNDLDFSSEDHVAVKYQYNISLVEI